MKLKIFPLENPLSGNLIVPPSKSQTLRAILFASLSHGVSRIENSLIAEDAQAMIKACETLGVHIQSQENCLVITSPGLKGLCAIDVVDAKDSGIVLRFLAGIAACLPSYTLITGSQSLRQKRTVAPILTALSNLNAFAVSSRENGFAPIVIKGKLSSGKVFIQGEDSQMVSSLLLATSFSEGLFEIEVLNSGETPWVDMTLFWLKRFGRVIHQRDHTHYQVFGSSKPLSPFTYRVPGDFSSLAFPLAAAVLGGSAVLLQGLDFEDAQGDKALLSVLKTMGADLLMEKDAVLVKNSSSLNGLAIDVNPLIDALPILSVLGCYANGTTTLYNAQVARYKESDRLSGISLELRKMGADIQEEPDRLILNHSQLKGAGLCAHGDHRLAMALTVAALFAKTPSTLEGFECIDKTYPQFLEHMRSLGAHLEVI